MKRSIRLSIAALTVAGVATAALSPGATVFIRSKNTRLLASADPSSPSLDTLQPGARVLWQRKAEQEQFHVVTATTGKKATGYVFFANLSLKEPAPEYLAKDPSRAVDGAAFSSSGAATKALSEGAIRYGKEKVENGPRTVASVLAVERLAESVDDAALAAHAARQGLVAPLLGGKAAGK